MRSLRSPGPWHEEVQMIMSQVPDGPFTERVGVLGKLAEQVIPEPVVEFNHRFCDSLIMAAHIAVESGDVTKLREVLKQVDESTPRINAPRERDRKRRAEEAAARPGPTTHGTRTIL